MPALVDAVRLGAQFARIDIIHPAVGTAMEKLRGAARPDVSERIMRLYTMCRTAATPYNAALNASYFCNACGRSAIDIESGPINHCAICLNTWHVSCESSMAASWSAASRERLPELLPGLPNCIVTANICKMCALAYEL